MTKENNFANGHNHDHDHDHSHDYEEGIELDTIFLEFEDPENPDDSIEVECGVLGIFDAQDKEYIAVVVPEGDGENLEDAVYIYQYQEDEEGNPILYNIEDDDEFDMVEEAFNEIFIID